MADPVLLANNLWVIICGLLVFTMTISVGFLEIGELGSDLEISLLKTMLITGSALFFMALVGFNTAFAPTINGVIGNPLYTGLFLGGSSTNISGLLTGAWWSQQSTGLTIGTYFLFETAFASVTLALVGVIVLRKMKMQAFFVYSIVYFIIIWNLPAAWIWNPTGWLAQMGMADFAGGLVVHGAAGAAGLGIILQVGWFGFNPGSVLAFNNEAMVVVLTTFLAAASAFLSVMFFRYQMTKEMPSLIYAANGVLMGLIVITPLAGFVSPLSAVVLGLLGGPLYLMGEKWFGKLKWFTDPVGLFPGHLLGGTFGVLMIPFFAQKAFVSGLASLTFQNGSLVPPSLTDGLFFGGGVSALNQLGIEAYGVAVVMISVFILSYVTSWVISIAMRGITPGTTKN